MNFFFDVQARDSTTDEQEEMGVETYDDVEFSLFKRYQVSFLAGRIPKDARGNPVCHVDHGCDCVADKYVSF